MAARCPSCGVPVRDDMAYCPSCGGSLLPGAAPVYSTVAYPQVHAYPPYNQYPVVPYPTMGVPHLPMTNLRMLAISGGVLTLIDGILALLLGFAMLFGWVWLSILLLLTFALSVLSSYSALRAWVPLLGLVGPICLIISGILVMLFGWFFMVAGIIGLVLAILSFIFIIVSLSDTRMRAEYYRPIPSEPYGHPQRPTMAPSPPPYAGGPPQYPGRNW